MKGFNIGVPNEKILKMMSPEDRKAMFPGTAGMTKEEIKTKSDTRAEKELQNQIVALLRRNDIVPIYSANHKKATTPKGTPDILFAVLGWRRDTLSAETVQEVFACAWELKTQSNTLDPDQEQMRDDMQREPNAWQWREIRSYDQALAELRAMGLALRQQEGETLVQLAEQGRL